jgi:hypothetical protein
LTAPQVCLPSDGLNRTPAIFTSLIAHGSMHIFTHSDFERIVKRVEPPPVPRHTNPEDFFAAAVWSSWPLSTVVL